MSIEKNDDCNRVQMDVVLINKLIHIIVVGSHSTKDQLTKSQRFI
jgi:hypothetical protein